MIFPGFPGVLFIFSGFQGRVGTLREVQEITAGLGGLAAICDRRLFGSTGLYNSMWYDLHLGSMCGHDLGSTVFYVFNYETQVTENVTTNCVVNESKLSAFHVCIRGAQCKCIQNAAYFALTIVVTLSAPVLLSHGPPAPPPPICSYLSNWGLPPPLWPWPPQTCSNLFTPDLLTSG